jgi:methanogenic corrinoid protein MtbC1
LHPILYVFDKPRCCVFVLRWCAYCQEFQGEVPPLDRFTTTHGICAACLLKGMDRLDTEISNSHRLRELQGRLHEAGKLGDTKAAPEIVKLALDGGLRPVDILVGLVTPLLYLIGSEWESGLITVAEEHRFTRFCERVFALVRVEVKARLPAPAVRPTLVFLLNAKGNHHTLGIRILALWLQSHGIETREFSPPPAPEVLVGCAVEDGAEAILISLALDRQKGYVCEVGRRVEALPVRRPMVIVGGYAVKHKLVLPIAGTVFVETMSGLPELIRGLGPFGDVELVGRPVTAG